MKRILLMFFVLSYLNTFAQEDEDLFSMSLEELMNIEVTTASKKAQKISDAPATVISYSAAQIELHGWRDLKDLFRALTGVDVSYDVQGEVKTLVTFRGVQGNQKVLVLQDGQRQNPITGERFIYGHNIPLNIYKRIEVVYGPASALYGADAYGGVINLITKDGADIDGMSASVGYVSTQAVDASMSFGKKMGDDVDVLLYGRMYNGQDYKLHEKYKDALDYGIVNEYAGELGELDKVYPIKNWNMIGKVKYKKLTFGFDWQHQLESNAPTCIPANYAYVRNNVWGQDIRHLYANYSIVENEKISVDATATVGDYAINPATNFFIPTDEIGADALPGQDGILDTGTPGYKYGYSGYVQGALKADWKIADNFNIIAGASFENVKSFPKTQNLDQPYHLDAGLEDDLRDFVDPNGNTYGVLGLTDSIFGERNFTNFGSFVQGEYKPIETLSITLGGRFDYNSIHKETFNPRIGIVYKPIRKLTLKAMGGSAYIAPSNYYRWENWANPYAMHIPNLDIKPEKLTSFEVSAIYYINNNLSLRTSLFRNDMKDIIRVIDAPDQEGAYSYYNVMRILDGGASPYSGYVEMNDNLGAVYSQGVELDVNYQISKFLISVGYSFIDGKDKETDSNIPKVSAHKANANITYNAEKFFASVSARYYSDIWTATTNSYYAGTDEIPGAFILYANLGYRITKGIVFTLSVDNMLNTKHWGAAPYGESVWIQPRAPQSLLKVFGGLKFTF
ncbi:MAG: TonB-dependent receptor [Salinivirgaceae bacterium]|nr:TonB-dependent receptor [Salinivirgaceae bacterium]